MKVDHSGTKISGLHCLSTREHTTTFEDGDRATITIDNFIIVTLYEVLQIDNKENWPAVRDRIYARGKIKGE